MAYSKLTIYNLALSSLLLAKEVTEISTDKSNEVRVLNLHWDVAFESTLKDLDLDTLSSRVTLALIAELAEDILWNFVYSYPANCALLRRIVTGALIDTGASLIDKHVRVLDGEKVIYTNEVDAVAEIIPNDFPISAMPGMACMAVAYKLAYLSAPLIVGKGAQKLRDELMKQYVVAKNEAQEDDAKENESYESDEARSEFVAARLS